MSSAFIAAKILGIFVCLILLKATYKTTVYEMPKDHVGQAVYLVLGLVFSFLELWLLIVLIRARGF